MCITLLEDLDAVPKFRTIKRQIDIASLSTEEFKKLDEMIVVFGRQSADFLRYFECQDKRHLCHGEPLLEASR